MTDVEARTEAGAQWLEPAAPSEQRSLARSGHRALLACAACGFIAPPIALLGLFGSGVAPPKTAHDSAAHVARVYAKHADLRMAGLVLAVMAIGGVGPLVTAISIQLRRTEGERPPIASLMQAIAGTVTWMFLTVPLLILFVAVYRAGHVPASTTQTLHDLGWILFLIPLPPFIVQNSAIAYGVLSDQSPEPLLPRWLAWANLWIAASFLPDLLLGFFKVGPFAYQGVFGFWIPTVTYGAWLNLMGFTLWRAIRRTDYEPAAVAEPAGVS